MTRTLPIILVLVLALGVFLVDPARRAGSMISPANLPLAGQDLSPILGRWIRDTSWNNTLPRAFPTHNQVWDGSARYVSSASGSEAFLLVVIAQDRRDLHAFDPTHAMRADGWEPIDGEIIGEFLQTRHTRHTNLLDEFRVLETAFVAPGRWGANPSITNAAGNDGPGWPGPGAIVQMRVAGSAGDDAAGLRDEVRRLAQQLSTELATVDAP